MAQLSQTAQEFLQNTFGPLVAVLCSHDAEVIAQKNNLTFVELARPFCRLSSEAHIRDPTGQLHAVKNLRVILTDGNSQPLPANAVKKKLSDAVGGCQPTTKEGETDNVITVGSYDLQLSLSTPWYESYRETVLNEMAPSEHEFLRHHVACMLVVSTAHPDPMEQFTKLSQEQHQLQHNANNQYPKWLSPNIFKYYVLLHDNTEGEEEKADAVYQSMKSTFGMQTCHLLRINSKSPEAADAAAVSNGDTSLPNPWVQYISPKLEKEGRPSDRGSTTNLASFPDKVKEEAELSNGGQSGDDTSSQDLDDGPNDPSPEDVVMVEVESPNSEVIPHPLAQNYNAGSREKSHSSMEDLDQDSDSLSQQDEGETKAKRDPGICLTLSDHDRLRIFIHEFVVRGLLPYMEKMIRNLSEGLQNRKGIHRSFVSATRKWFGSKNDRVPVTPVAPDVPKYLRESPELQMRRLADLSFLVQMYELAYTSYHTAKRDFNTDHAWLHLAGALEMAAISAFMHGNLQKAYPQHYMEHASHYYADVCKKINFASRNVMLYTEILKSNKMFNEAAMDFIKMTGEDSDLRSALFLEQAALCFIALPKPKVRKYAFHMILAGHRFSKASQRRHALRCYCQALQVYKGKGWSLAEDHINFTIGRQCLNLRQLENATSALQHLLTQESHQPAAQQGSFLREYLFVFKQLSEQKRKEGLEQTSLPQLPLPVTNKAAIRVLLTNPNRPQYSDKTAATSVTFDCILNQTEMKEWKQLELMALSRFSSKLPAGFKPSVHLFHSRTDNSVHPLAVVEEPITLEIVMENPLKVPLVLSQIHLLWRFIPVDFETTNKENPEQKPVAISNETPDDADVGHKESNVIDTEYLDEVIIPGREYKIIYLRVVPKQTGELHITGLGYGLSSQSNAGTDVDAGIQENSAGKRPLTFSSSVVTIPGMQELDIQGPRLNNTKLERCSVIYGPDWRLDPVIVPHMPKLEVFFQDFPTTLLSGEVCLVNVELVNEGQCGLSKLLVATDHPEFFTFGFSCSPGDGDLSPPDMLKGNLLGSSVYRSIPDTESKTDEKFMTKCNVSHVTEIPLDGRVLSPGCKMTLPMWVRGPDTSGMHEIKMLFYYQSAEDNLKMRHRTLHHTVVINTANSVSLSASAHRGQCSAGSKDSGNFQLSVHLAIENMNQLHDSNIAEFSVSQVSCVSSRWSLHPVVDTSEEMKICGGESLRINFRARQHSQYLQGGVSSEFLSFSNCCFGKEMIESASTPCVDFCFRSFLGTGPVDETPRLLPGTATSTPTISPSPSSHELSILAIEDKARLKEDLDCSQAAEMMLVVLWKAFVVDEEGESHALVGQNHITLEVQDQEQTTHVLHKKPAEMVPVKFTKEPERVNQDIPKPEVLAQLLHYNLQFQPVIEHDFNKSVLCRVPIQLQIYNCCLCDLEVFIETNPGDNSLSQPADYSAIFLPPDSSTFAWCSLSSQIINLPPSKQAATTLHACFGSPGVYNLNSIQLYVRDPTQQPSNSTENKTGQYNLIRQKSDYLKQNSLPTSMITVISSQSSET